MSVEHAVRSIDSQSNSFQSSLNSIDENRSIDEFSDFIFTLKQCPDIYSSNYFNEKRQSEPAIRFSFYNKLFDMDSRMPQRLLSPPKDFRKYSLPLSMSSQPDCPVSSLMSSNSSCKFTEDVPSWRSFNTFMRKPNHNNGKIKLTISDENGQEMIQNSSSSSIERVSSDEDICLFYRGNLPQQNNQFENNFIDDSSMNESKICHKCGHYPKRKF